MTAGLQTLRLRLFMATISGLDARTEQSSRPTHKEVLLNIAVPTSSDEIAQLRMILDAHEDCIKVLELDGRIRSINAGGVAALEIGAASDILDANWPDTWPGDMRKVAERAVADAAGGAAASFAGSTVTPKGTPKLWDVRVTPMLDSQGAPTAILVVSRDITELQRARDDRSDLNALHSAVLASSTDYAIIALDRDGLVTLWNEGARRIMQWTEDEILGRPAHIFFTPEEVTAGVPEAEMSMALQVGKGEDERWHERKDGSKFWATGLMMPLRTTEGRHLGYIKILRDQTDARHAEEHRQLMIGELNHRVKNSLAVVQGIVSHTLRAASSPEAARRSVMERLTILSRAQDTLTRTSWDGAPVREIVELATAPLSPGEGRLHLAGPDFDLGSRAVLALTMALHELGTNALKYGALSNDIGSVTVSWRVDDDHFSLTWTEQGGPLVVAPKRRGFGSRLIESGLARGLGGKASLDFRPQGVCWTIQAPLAALRDS
jgi:PAS domain S-box-containing protein